MIGGDNYGQNRILIVEDDKNLRVGLSLALSSESMETVEASTIKEAKDLLNAKSFSLIILDCNLPDGNGIDFCKNLRSSSNIPVIFFNGK